MVNKLILHIVKSIVVEQDKVRVEDQTNGSTYIVNIWVAQDDMKRIIGKEGRVIKAIRALINALSSAEQVDVVLDSQA
ncbi:MAG: KH domain-containing protein [Candidatus Babeliales bacterium]